MNTNFCDSIKLSLLVLLSMPSIVFADCRDLTLKMKDPRGGDNAREITSFLNCHTGSYFHPGATTVHLFEWKSVSGQRKLCQTTRTCGNAKIWRASVTSGAVFTWGNSVTDILNNTRFQNNFRRLADGTPAGDGGDGGDISNSDISAFVRDNSNNVCVNTNHNSVKVYGQGGNVSTGDVNCYSKSSMSLDQWKSWENDLVSDGYSSANNTDITNPNISVLCKAGDAGAGLGANSGNVSIPSIQDCRGAGVNVVGGQGGAGGAGTSPSFGIDNGRSRTNGEFDTRYNELRVYLEFNSTWENIKRYCADPQPEWCY